MFIDLKIENVVRSTSKWSAYDVDLYKARKDKVLISLEEYLLDGNNLLDATKIQGSVFPEIDIDVFISHSHADEDEAVKIALSLEEIGLVPFVDSCVWGYADELLRKIDDKFCIPKGWENYSYGLRNRTTTNVHLILNVALQQMIHRSELFIFLGTENSIKIDEYMSDIERISSPWIFSEMMFAKNVKRSPRKQVFNANESYDIKGSQRKLEEMEFRFDLPELKHKLDFNRFMSWLDNGSSVDRNLLGRVAGLMHLDELYQLLEISPDLLSRPRVELGN